MKTPDEIKKGLESAKGMWVKTEERLPKPMAKVMTYSPKNGYQMAVQVIGVWFFMQMFEDPKYWMYLPEPPKEDNP